VAGLSSRPCEKDFRADWVGFRCAEETDDFVSTNIEVPYTARIINWIFNRLGIGTPIIEQLQTEEPNDIPEDSSTEDRVRQITIPDNAITFDDHGDVIDEATPLSLGQQRSGEFRHKNDVDVFAWQAQILGEYEIKIMPYLPCTMRITILASTEQEWQDRTVMTEVVSEVTDIAVQVG